MSVQDLIAKWEDALVQALRAQEPEQALSDEELQEARVPVKSNLRAGEEGCNTVTEVACW